MRDTVLFSGVFLFGVLISAVAQLFLKKSAGEEHEGFLREYINVKVLSAYGIFVLATLCSVYAYTVIPLSLGPVLGAAEYLFVAALGRCFLGEKLRRRQLAGLALIVAGIAVYAL